MEASVIPLLLLAEAVAYVHAVPDELCGRESNMRLFGGQRVNLGEVPHAVSINVKTGHNRYFLKCGGSILNEHWVLTAGHCVGDFAGMYRKFTYYNCAIVEITAGRLDSKIKDNVTTKYEQRKEAEKLIPYENFRDNGNDIALIKVNSPFQFNDYVKPISLPSQKEAVKPGQICQTSGWGRGGNAPCLKQVDLRLSTDTSKCHKMYQEDCGVDLTSVATCFDVIGHNSICHGDSGGGLICNDVVFGVNVDIIPEICESAEFTTVATVSLYLDWIHESLKDVDHSSIWQKLCVSPNRQPHEVLDGRYVSRTDYPFMTYYFRPDKKFERTCSGVILNEKWILSAAQCLHYRSPTRTTANIVIVGSIRKETYFSFCEIQTDGFNNTEIGTNGIALMQLYSSIPFSKYVQPIKLQKEQENFSPKECMAVGWGKTTIGRIQTGCLQEVKVSIMPTEDCLAAGNNTQDDLDFQNGKDILCGYTKNVETLQRSELGSPLLCDGMFTGVLISFLHTSKGRLLVYSKVTTQVDWIESHIKNKGRIHPSTYHLRGIVLDNKTFNEDF